MRKWLPLLLIVGATALSGVWYDRLPADVSLAPHELLPFGAGAGAETVPRVIVAFGLPTLALLLWALLHDAPRRLTGRLAARLSALRSATGQGPHGATATPFDAYAPTYRAIVTWVVALVLSFQVAFLGMALGWVAAPGRIVGVVFGAGLVLVGNVLPRLRPNAVAGIRTSRTLGDPQLWARVHRRYGALWIASGALVLASALAAPRYALLAGALALLVSSLAMLVGERLLVTGCLVLSAASAVSATAGRAEAQAVAATSHADTVAPSTVRESVMPLEAEGLALHGVLTLPAREHEAGERPPLALIVAGSGPTDHQGNSLAAPVRPYLYARLAWGLAERGIASVRYDKRGIGRSVVHADPTTLTLGRYRDDVIALARQLRKDPRFGRLVLVGHSEGAGLVLEAANAGAPADGFVMLSGAGRPLVQLLRDQFHVQYDSAASARLEASFRAFLDGADPADVPDDLKPLFFPQYRAMLRSMAAYDPAAEMRRSRLPALVVHGRMDLQATDADFAALVAARPAVHRLAIPEANHVYKAVTQRTLPGQMASYTNPMLPLVPELVPAVADWILTLAATSPDPGGPGSGA